MSPLPSPSCLSPTARALVLLVAGAAMLAAACSTRDLWAPDEPRYGEVVRETLEQGHWLVPHVNGEPYAEKPPLYFWVAAGLSAPFGGVSAITARLAAALFAAGAVLLTARLGRRLFRDPDLGITAALIFASCGLVLWNGPRAALDLPLTFFVLLAVEAGITWRDEGRLLAAAAAGAGWAGAILVKGPVGVFLPPLVWVVAFVAARRAPRWSNPGWWLIPLLGVGLCLAWLLPALDAGGATYADRLLGQIRDRASGVEPGHQRGPTYYFVRVLPVTLPWAFHILAGAGLAFTIRRRPPADRPGLWVAAFGSLAYLLILTTFGTKREVYLIPGLPFAALLAAYGVHHEVLPSLQRFGRMVASLCLAGLGLTVLLFPFGVAWAGEREAYAGLDPPAWPTIAAACAAGLGLLAAALVVWRLRARARLAVHVAAVFVLLGAVVAHTLVLPLLDPVKSMASCAAAADRASEGGPVFIGGWDQGPNLLWQLDRPSVAEVEDVATLERLLAPDAPRTAIVAEERWWTAVVGDLPFRPREAWKGRVGNRDLRVVTNPR